MAADIEHIFQDFILNKIREIEDQNEDKGVCAGAAVDGAVQDPAQGPGLGPEAGPVPGPEPDPVEANVPKKHKKLKKHKSKKKKNRERESGSESGTDGEREGRGTSPQTSKDPGEDGDGRSRRPHSTGKKKRKKKKKRRRRRTKGGESSDSDGKRDESGQAASLRRQEDLPDIIPKQDGAAKGRGDEDRGSPSTAGRSPSPRSGSNLNNTACETTPALEEPPPATQHASGGVETPVAAPEDVERSEEPDSGALVAAPTEPECTAAQQEAPPSPPPGKKSRGASRSPLRSKDAKSAKKRRRSKSPHRRSRRGSGSKSPSHKKRSRSRSPSHKKRSRSKSPSHKKRSGSKSPSHKKRSGSISPSHKKRSGSISPSHKKKSRSRSPSHKKSRSRSPSHKKTSGSISPSHKKRSGSKSPSHNKKSRSRSPSHKKKSRSRSPSHKKRSGSKSPSHKKRSGSKSPSHKKRSGSKSPSHKKKSRSRSPSHKKRSGSKSPSHKKKSRSRSPSHKKRSGSKSPSHKKRSGSKSPSHKKTSGSKSPSHKKRSGSKSPSHKKTSGSKSPSHKKKSRSKTPSRKKRARSSSPSHKKRARSSSPSHRKRSRSKSPAHRRRSRSRSPSHRKRSRSRSGGRRSSRRSRSASRSRKRVTYSQRDRWKREPSHSPVLILRKNRSPSRKHCSPQRISDLDKEQLLEIAKANAAAMCAKAGMPVPASLRTSMMPLALPSMAMNAAMASMTAATVTAALSNMSTLSSLLPSISNKPPSSSSQPSVALEEVRRRVEKQANSISIKEFTEKCQMIVDSSAELPVALPHVSDEEDDGKSFAASTLREQKVINFSINNLTVRPAGRSDADMAKEFPVSSGSQHRKKEGDGAYGEWVPVEKTSEKTSKKAPAHSSPPGGEAPPEVQPEENVFPEPLLQSVDITQAVTERIRAQRRLAENPYDITAICMLSRAQEQVDAWAQSNTVPGLFTGSTGAQVLSSEELSSGGPQAWLKKDQFLRAAPVSGGVGEFLMRKMGWRTGEGLGRNREGTVEPIVIDFKVDRKGLVAEGEKPQKQTGGLVVTKDLMGKHPVSALIELCNKRRIMQPDFVMVHHSGPDHRKNFLFKVTVNGVDYQPQTASPNKKHAKAMAATVALQALGEVSSDGPGLYTGPVFTAASTGPLFST